MREEAKQRHNHPEERHKVSAHTIRAEISRQPHGPSWGRRVIEQIQPATDGQNEHTQPHDAGKSHEQDEDSLYHRSRLLAPIPCLPLVVVLATTNRLRHARSRVYCPFVQGDTGPEVTTPGGTVMSSS